MESRTVIEQIVEEHSGFSKERITLMDFYEVEGCSPGSKLKDVRGKVIPGLSGEGQIFYVDMAPLANWAHDCVYISVSDIGVQYIQHNWPLCDDFTLRQL